MNLFPNENLCFLLISDGGGSVGPLGISKLEAAYKKAINSGCWTCFTCIYVHVDDKVGDGIFFFKEFCDKIGGQFHQITPNTYEELTDRIANNIIKTHAVEDPLAPPQGP